MWKLAVATGVAVTGVAAVWRFTEPRPVGLASTAAAFGMAHDDHRGLTPFRSRCPAGSSTDPIRSVEPDPAVAEAAVTEPG